MAYITQAAGSSLTHSTHYLPQGDIKDSALAVQKSIIDRHAPLKKSKSNLRIKKNPDHQRHCKIHKPKKPII